MSEETTIPNIIRADKNFFLEGEKIGFLRPDGKIQMTPGNAEHRAALETFLKIDAAQPVNTPLPQPHPLPAPKMEKKASTALSTSIPPCPPEEPEAGDKTPAVIAWYFKYKPDVAAEKYKNRKFTIKAETSNS
jgi:hypothetical protein